MRYLFGQPGSPCLLARSYSLILRDFNPRTPCGVRLHTIGSFSSISNFNPRTPCGVRRDDYCRNGCCPRISIHAPLAGCDRLDTKINRDIDISIHAPLAGCDSTRSTTTAICRSISIHAPLAGCDRIRFMYICCIRNFNPRTPCGVRHTPGAKGNPAQLISIHAPLAGCDVQGRQPGSWGGYFNPRTPCGVRLDVVCKHGLVRCVFQSTHPLRGATVKTAFEVLHKDISIHAPLAGCDVMRNITGALKDLFQSTHPLRALT